MQILNVSEVAKLTGLSRTTIWRLERRGEFPPRRNITPHRVGWFEHEIEEWVETRPICEVGPLPASIC